MKILYRDLIKFLSEKPTASEISKSLFQLGHEHELKNEVFEMEFTPNRGDCLSVMGLARDLNIFYGKNDYLEIFDDPIEKFDFKFDNLSIDSCTSISFLELEVKDNKPKYKDYLETYFNNTEQKKNNFFADITNYLSYEIGQPSHCYDSEKITGEIVFEKRVCNEEFETLLGEKIKLEGINSVFSMDDKAICLAGVIGGNETACTPSTKKAIIEFASFNPEDILGKSIKYNIHSDAAYKFERGVDNEMQDFALRRFIEIVKEHTEIISLRCFKNQYINQSKKFIDLDINKINKILGTSLTYEECINFLSKLGFRLNGRIEVPSFRRDIETHNDIAEEIARLIGYDNIQKKQISINVEKKNSSELDLLSIKEYLVNSGFNEVINFPFSSIGGKNSIFVDNPLDSNKRFLRVSLKESLINNLLYNERRQKDSIKLFEFSDIYSKKDSIEHTPRLGIIASGRISHDYKNFSRKIDERYIKDICSKIFKDVLSIEEIKREDLDTKINEKIFFLEIGLNQFHYESKLGSKRYFDIKEFHSFSPISEFPSSRRDFSFSITDSNMVEKVINYFNKLAIENLKEVFMFDFFLNKKKKEVKIGYRLVFQSLEKTLSETEIQEMVSKILRPILELKGIEIPGLEKHH